jgi:ankyrin repeat protein
LRQRLSFEKFYKKKFGNDFFFNNNNFCEFKKSVFCFFTQNFKKKMSSEKLTGKQRERKDPTEELKELAANDEMSDEELQPLVRQALDDGADFNAIVRQNGEDPSADDGDGDDEDNDFDDDEDDEEEEEEEEQDDDGEEEEQEENVTYPVLHGFIRRGHVRCVEEVLFKKPNLEKKNSDGGTALQVALLSNISETQMVKIVHLLLFAGADVNAKAAINPSPLVLAVYQNLTSVVKELLRSNPKPDLSKTDANEGTSLTLAAAIGNETITRDLIKSGAKLESTRSTDKATPLLSAAENGCYNTVKILLEAGAKIDAKNKRDETALHLAAQKGHANICELLIQSGVKKNTLNDSGRSPLTLAILHNQLETAAVLVTLGCEWNGSYVVFINLIARNQISMFTLLVRDYGSLPSSLINSIVDQERIEFLDLLFDDAVENSLSVGQAQDLLQRSKNNQIKRILQKWIDKQNGIPEVKKEEGENF